MFSGGGHLAATSGQDTAALDGNLVYYSFYNYRNFVIYEFKLYVFIYISSDIIISSWKNIANRWGIGRKRLLQMDASINLARIE